LIDRGKLDRGQRAAYGRRIVEEVRDVGKPPAIKDPKRRELCRSDLRLFLVSYFPASFPLSFSPDHEYLIQTTQTVILDEGRFICAMPRGSGKTSIFRCAMVWATLYGHRKFPVLISADDSNFKLQLKSIKLTLEKNDLLFEDFPEVLHPIRSMQGSDARARAQLADGELTHLGWSSDRLIFPTTPWTLAAGNAAACVSGGGLTSAKLRGQLHTTASGEQIRPDAALVDDPQTRATAKSTTRCQEREDIIKGDILGMAGPGKSLSMVIGCTVIYQSDLAERLLDRGRSPEFTAMRVSTIKSWPTNMELWDQYADRRRQELREELPKDAAHQFYRENRAAMDAGSHVYWAERISPGFVSALETAMSEWIDDPRSFMAEKQNTPDAEINGDFVPLNALELAKRCAPFKRNAIPPTAETITAFIDVQQSLLYWVLVAWSPGFAGQVIDYGTWPSQNSRHFTLSAVKGRTLQRKYGEHDSDGAIRQGLIDLMSELVSRQWKRAGDGALMRLDLGLVDARYKWSHVEAAIIQSRLGNSFVPASGVGIGAKDVPLKLRTPWKGRAGDFWVWQKPADRLLKSIFVDTNHWKTEIYLGLSVPQAHTSAIQFYDETAQHHQMLADQCCTERADRMEAKGKGRTIDEWELPSNKPDNHFWDCLVGNAVAASVRGIHKEGAIHVIARPVRQRRTRTINF
jgi:hypothetical protein